MDPKRGSGRTRGGWFWVPALTLALGAAGPAASQEAPTALADEQWAAGDIRAAYQTLDQALIGDPDAYPLLWRATRAAAVLAVTGDGDRERWLRRAADLSERAIDADSTGLDARHWRLYALGELALKAGPRTAGRLARQIFREANALLERDSLDAYAHNALGRVSYEVVTLSGFERFLGRLVVGAEVMGHASWEQARVHLTRAVELRPDFMPFRTAMGAYYARNGRGAEAKAEFRRALELATSHPWNRALATEARERLDNVLTWAPDPPKKEGEPGGG